MKNQDLNTKQKWLLKQLEDLIIQARLSTRYHEPYEKIEMLLDLSHNIPGFIANIDNFDKKRFLEDIKFVNGVWKKLDDSSNMDDNEETKIGFSELELNE